MSNVQPSQIRVGDRIKVVDVTEMTVTSIDEGYVRGTALDGTEIGKYIELYTGNITRKFQMVEAAPRVLPEGSVVMFPGTGSTYVQTKDGYKRLHTRGTPQVIKEPTALAGAVNDGDATLVYTPGE